MLRDLLVNYAVSGNAIFNQLKEDAIKEAKQGRWQLRRTYHTNGLYPSEEMVFKCFMSDLKEALNQLRDEGVKCYYTLYDENYNELDQYAYYDAYYGQVKEIAVALYWD